MTTDLIKITPAAHLLGISKSTLGRWHETGKFSADFVTVFSARLYGARSHKNRRMIAEMKAAAGSAHVSDSANELAE